MDVIREYVEKIWYIIDGDHHFGPYEYGEIEALRLQNKIRSTGKVISRDELRDRLNGVHVPSIRVIAEPPAPKRNFHSKRLPSFDLTNPPEISIAKRTIPKRSRITKLSTLSALSINSVTKFFDRESTYVYNTRSIWPWLHAFFCFVMGIYAWQSVQFITPRAIPKKPLHMENREYVQALNTLRAPLHQWKFSLIQSKDFKTAWVASNYPGTLDIILTLQSKDQQVLSKDMVSAYTELSLDSGLSSVPNDHWTFVSGDKIAPGKYQVTVQIKNQSGDWEQKWLSRKLPTTQVISFETSLGTYSDYKLDTELAKFWRKEFAPPKITKVIKAPKEPKENVLPTKSDPVTQNHMATATDSSAPLDDTSLYHEEDFGDSTRDIASDKNTLQIENKNIKQMGAIATGNNSFKVETITELQEQFRLVISIIGQIRSWSMEVPFLSKKELDSKIVLWQQIYQKQFGALFTGLALDNAEKEKEHKGYRMISSITQKVGARSMDFFADAKKWKSSKNSKANEKFAKDLQKLISQAENQLTDLETQRNPQTQKTTGN